MLSFMLTSDPYAVDVLDEDRRRLCSLQYHEERPARIVLSPSGPYELTIQQLAQIMSEYLIIKTSRPPRSQTGGRGSAVAGPPTSLEPPEPPPTTA
jgi:hypothetical protein